MPDTIKDVVRRSHQRRQMGDCYQDDDFIPEPKEVRDPGTSEIYHITQDNYDVFSAMVVFPGDQSVRLFVRRDQSVVRLSLDSDDQVHPVSEGQFAETLLRLYAYSFDPGLQIDPQQWYARGR
jgi:hypothetical protein